MDFIAIGISFLALLISFSRIYISKFIEIRYKKFEEICINQINANLDRIEKIILENQKDLVNAHLSEIRTILNNTMISLTRLGNIYKGFDIDILQDISHDFTDVAVTKSYIVELQAAFYIMKVDFFNGVYKYGMKSVYSVNWRKPLFWNFIFRYTLIEYLNFILFSLIIVFLIYGILTFHEILLAFREFIG